MNQKNTTKKVVATTDAKSSIANAKPDAPAAKYSSFGGIMKAKTSGSLPRGIKVNFDGPAIVFSTAKLGNVATIPVAEFAAGELKRHGFSFAK